MPIETFKLIRESSTEGEDSADISTSELPFKGLATRHRIVLDYIFAGVQNDERPYLNVDVYGYSFRALLDSGASNTVLGGPGWKILEALGIGVTTSKISSVTLANGHPCVILGTVTLPIAIKHKLILLDVLVIPDVPHSMILGIDFWKRVNFIPNFRSGHWSFGPESELNVITTTHLSPLSNLTPAEKGLIDSLLTHPVINTSSLGCTDLVEHKIRTLAEPIKQRYYPLSPALRTIAYDELDSMLTLGVVEPSNSPWSSPIVLVKKKDNSYRFCVDYRKVNAVTEKDAYPIPYLSSILDRLRDAKFLTSLDIRSAYWQIPLSPDSKAITAFTVPGRGLYQFTRLPFGLHNSPATFQRLIDRILGAKVEPFCFAYLDDIIIATPTFEQHIAVLTEILTRLSDAGLTLRKEKCHFCRPELKYLGYVVNGNGLLVDPEKVEAIISIPTPKNVSEVRRFVGMAGWYRRFIPNFSSVLTPLTTLTKKDTPFVWSADCEQAFSFLKQQLVSAPILACPDFSLPFTIQADASDFGLGAVLTQQNPSGEQVISYISRSLTKPERHYSTTEKECLAVIWAVEKFRSYIEGSHFSVVTDHHSLLWLHKLQNPSGRLARWALRLQHYDFTIIHRKGKEHIVPDTLSRAVPKLDALNAVNGSSQLALPISDPWYETLRDRISSDPDGYPLWSVQDGLIYKQVSTSRLSDSNLGNWRLLVPKSQRERILREHHDPPTCGHCGVAKTMARIQQQFYWPKLRADVARYIRRCRICAEQKVEQKPSAGFFAPRATPTHPWQVLCCDIVGPLPRSSKGHVFILVVVDFFTKFSCFYPLRTATASAVTRIIEDNIFLMFGSPQYLITDNGVQFKSKEFTKLCSQYRTKILYTAKYHPQANPAERVNRVLKTMLSSYIKDNQRNWDVNLSKIGRAIRTSKHEVTGYTPFFALFGREQVLYGDSFQSCLDANDPMINPDRSQIQKRSPDFDESLRNDILTRMRRSTQRTQTRYNLRRRPVRYNLNDLVWKRNFALSDASKYFNSKLAPRFVGPCRIAKVMSPWTYEVADSLGNSLGIYHVKDLKPDHTIDRAVSGESAANSTDSDSFGEEDHAPGRYHTRSKGPVRDSPAQIS